MLAYGRSSRGCLGSSLSESRPLGIDSTIAAEGHARRRAVDRVVDRDGFPGGIGDGAFRSSLNEDLPLPAAQQRRHFRSGVPQLRQRSPRDGGLQVGGVMTDDQQRATGCDPVGEATKQRLAGLGREVHELRGDQIKGRVLRPPAENVLLMQSIRSATSAPASAACCVPCPTPPQTRR